MNEISKYIQEQAHAGIYGIDLYSKAAAHFAERGTIMGLLMDDTPLSRRILNAIQDVIKPDLFQAVVKANNN